MDKQQPGGIGFSYRRFSYKGQERGESLARQYREAQAWCKRQGVRLDTTLDLEDKAVPAFRGLNRKNPERYALAAFLALVEADRIPRGSFLIVEALDRLTREHIRPALTLCLNLIERGVRIVQLKPVEMVYDENADPMQIMMMIMELARGHSESKMKESRVGDAWRQKKQAARQNGENLTRNLPAWVKLVGGRRVAVPGRACTVQRIFELARDGYGEMATVRALIAEGHAPMGSSGTWHKHYVQTLLTDRRVLGEYQPRGPGLEPEGDPIPGYYPAVVSPDLFALAQAGRRKRRKHRGAIGKHVNLFAGLVVDAIDGGRYIGSKTSKGSGGKRVLSTYASHEGRGSFRSFPLEPFEEHILAHLRELPPADVLGVQDPADDRTRLTAELARVEAQLEEVGRLLEDEPSRLLAQHARALEENADRLQGELDAANQAIATPTHDAWAQAKSLLRLTREAPDPIAFRLRLRALLRRMLEEIRLLVVARGTDRLAAVQLWFADGVRSRTYLVFYRRRRGNGRASKPAQSWSVSYPGPGEIDLRKPEDVALAEEFLLALDLK
jgi:DNA invertase Pin-like site-specific DNA recombinase